MIKKNIAPFLIIILCVFTCGLFMIWSDKSINSDGHIWLYRMFNQGVFTHDGLSYRFITFFSQIIPLSLINLKAYPFLVLKGFVFNQVLIYLFFPLFFIYRYLKTNDTFYLCPLFAFVTMNIATDSFLCNVAGESSMFAWLLFDVLRRDIASNIKTVFVVILCSILCFSYETTFLMAILGIAFIFHKTKDFTPHTYLQLVSLFTVIPTNIYIALSSVPQDTSHSKQFMSSLLNIPEQQGVFAFFALILFLLTITFKNFTTKFYLPIAGLFLLLATYLCSAPLFTSSAIFADAYHMRTMTLPFSFIIGFIYIYRNKVPSVSLIAGVALLMSVFSIYGSIDYNKRTDSFKKMLKNVDGCLVLNEDQQTRESGLLNWYNVYKSIAYMKTRRIEKLITNDDVSKTDCYQNFIHNVPPSGNYFILD